MSGNLPLQQQQAFRNGISTCLHKMGHVLQTSDFSDTNSFLRLSSNLGMDTSYPDCQLLLVKCSHLTQFRLLPRPSTSTLIHCSLTILTWFQASAARSMGSVLLFWKITQRIVVTTRIYQRFGTTYSSHLQMLRILLDDAERKYTLYLKSSSWHHPQHPNCISSVSSSSKSKLTFSKYHLDFLFNPSPKYPHYALIAASCGSAVSLVWDHLLPQPSYPSPR
jgi:hypothetical protein